MIVYDGLKLTNRLTNDIIGRKNFPKNRTEWEDMAKQLMNTCIKFAKQ